MTQVVVQILAFASGILVIRFIAPEQYALYTLANTFIGALGVLANSGITSGALSQGGRVWADKERLGAVIVTSISLRKRFAIISSVFVFPVFVWLVLKHNSSLLESSLLVAAVFFTFYSSLTNSIYEIAPKLHQRAGGIGKIRAVAALFRLILLFPVLSIRAQAFSALFAGALSQFWANRQLKKIGSRYVDWNQNVDANLREETLGIVRKVIPGSIYYCISGQLAVLLISIFGSTTAIADVGAVGRLAQVLTFFSALANVVLIPRFAKIQNNSRLMFAFWGLFLAAGFFGSGIFVLSLFFEKQLLWILGSSYSGLEKELVLAVTGGIFSLLNALAYQLGYCRGWIPSQWVFIALSISTQLAGALFLNLGTAQGVLALNLLSSITGFVFYFTYNAYRVAASCKIS